MPQTADKLANLTNAYHATADRADGPGLSVDEMDAIAVAESKLLARAARVPAPDYKGVELKLEAVARDSATQLSQNGEALLASVFADMQRLSGRPWRG
jgi:hypothetical protein